MMTGCRRTAAPGSSNSGANGNYWSATQDGSNVRNLNFNDGNLNVNTNDPAYPFSVRLFREESAAVRRARSLKH